MKMKKLILITILTTTLMNCSQDTGIEEYNCIRKGDGAEIKLSFNLVDNLFTETQENSIEDGFIKEKNTIHLVLHGYDQKKKEAYPYAFFNMKTKAFYFLPFAFDKQKNVPPLTDLPLYDKDDEFLIANCK